MVSAPALHAEGHGFESTLRYNFDENFFEWISGNRNTYMYICISITSQHWMVAEILPHMEDKYLFLMHAQYHGYWWPADTRSQDINNHGNDKLSWQSSARIFQSQHQKG